MRVVVTGGAGYIGTLLCPMLLERGHEVALFDNFMFGVAPVLGFAQHSKLSLISGDVRDEGAVRKAVAAADAVIHLAGIVGYPACASDEDRAVGTNVKGTENVCKALSPTQRLIFASTGSTYGQVEGVADEETPINPLTLYGRTKREGEKRVLERGGVSLRFATVFGVSPRLRLDLIVNDFCYQAARSRFIVIFEGHHRRTFLHARDAAASYLLALDKYAEMQGQVYNVGSAELNFTKIEVARRIRKYTNFYLHEADVGEDLDKRDYEVAYAKIAKLGFHATVSLDEGIQEILKIVPLVTIESVWRNA